MYKKILVCVDFSDSTLKAITKAQEFSKVFGAEVHLVHIIKPIASFAFHGYYYPMDIELEKTALEKAQEKMKQIATDLKCDDAHTHTFFDDPKTGIIQYASEMGADLIMLAGHHHSKLGMLGSVASFVANKAQCDVLIVQS